MTQALIGIIVLLVLANIGFVYLTVKAIQDSQERYTTSLRDMIVTLNHQANNERQWWQHQLQIALNRSQFPEVAEMQTASSAEARAEATEAEYVDENKELELQEQPDGDAAEAWSRRLDGIRLS